MPSEFWLRLVTAAALACAVVLVTTPAIRRFALARGWVARPLNDRWGRRVIARAGGVGIYLGFLVASLCCAPWTWMTITVLGGASLVVVFGLVDDIRRIRPYTKLLLQLIAGCVMVFAGVRIELIQEPWLAFPFSVFWFVLVMNAFNLLDNMDGLAAGAGAIAALFCGLHAIWSREWTAAVLAASIGGGCLGFLRSNFPPAKIFMGDSGSHLLGLSLGSLALMGNWRHSTQLVSVLAVPALVLAVPIFDTCFVTIQRLLHGRHPFQGGTDHVSHRLAILGLSPRQTVVALYGLSSLLGAVSLVSIWVAPWSAVTLWLVVLAGLLVTAGFLARVRVYQLVREPSEMAPAFSGPPITPLSAALFHKRRVLEVLIDFVVICGAYVGAHLLRFEGMLAASQERLLMQSLPLILVVQLTSIAAVGLYRGVWRYVSVADVLAILKGVTIGTMGSALAVLYLWRFEGFSRAVFIIDGLLLFVGLSASRVGERLFNEWLSRTVKGVPAVIIGAGDLGELALRQLKHDQRIKRRVIGFLDDDRAKQGARIHGVMVLGTRDRLRSLLAERQVGEVLIAMEAPPPALLEFVQHHCEAAGVQWQLVNRLVGTFHEAVR